MKPVGNLLIWADLDGKTIKQLKEILNKYRDTDVLQGQEHKYESGLTQDYLTIMRPDNNNN